MSGGSSVIEEEWQAEDMPLSSLPGYVDNPIPAQEARKSTDDAHII
jgi:hypothetical protein